MTALVLDHLAVAAPSLDEAAAYVERTLGVSMAPGGRHPAMGTHNRLLSLGPGMYLEAIAVDPEADPPARPRWFGLDALTGPARLAAWIVRGGDPSARPAEIGAPATITRDDLTWRFTLRDDGALPWDGGGPAHIDWGPAGPPAGRLPATGCSLARLEVTHPEAHAILAAWPELLTLENVRIGPGPKPALRAEILTPRGLRFLE